MAGRSLGAPDRWAIALVLVAATAGLYAAVIAWTGGFDLRVTGVRVSSHNWIRPALFALLIGIPSAVVARSAIAAALRAGWAIANRPRTGVVLALAATALTLVAGLMFGTFAAGGADSYGYLSQAKLFAARHLTEAIPSSPSFTWDNAPATLTPLAYTRAAEPDRMAPVYPPGLPLLLAPLTWAGDWAPFALVPLSGALLVWAVFAIGRALGDPLAGAAGAALLSASATFLYQLVQPMSDVPAAACWTLALLLARGNGAAAGLLTGLAILIRPNLAPLAAIVLVVAWLYAPPAARYRRMAVFCTIAGACVALLAWIQFVRYGSPLASGYGSASDLFSASHIVPNLERYPRWLSEAYTPFIWLFALGPLWIRTTARPRVLAWAVYAMALAVFALYLPYVYFQPDEWFYTRFLLPGIGLLLVLACGVALTAIRRLPGAVGIVVIVAGGAAGAASLLLRAEERGVFTLRRQEQKYLAAGAFVRDRLPRTAVVFAMQHSGSIRFYADRVTVRWDLLPPRALDDALGSLRRGGLEPYAVLDAGEVPAFRERFAGATPAAVNGMTLVAVVGDAQVYRFE